MYVFLLDKQNKVFYAHFYARLGISIWRFLCDILVMKSFWNPHVIFEALFFLIEKNKKILKKLNVPILFQRKNIHTVELSLMEYPDGQAWQNALETDVLI